MTGQDHKQSLTFALSPEYRAEFCRAAVEKILNAATVPDSGASKPARLGKSLAGFKKLPPIRMGYPLEIGDEMPDGTIYAGISPDTGKPMYVMPQDAPGVYTFEKAAKYAKKLEAHGHKDFRVPTKNELNVLYQNRDKGRLKGTFNETGSPPAGYYWSSSPCSNGDAWDQRFSDGGQSNDYRYLGSSLRCVR